MEGYLSRPLRLSHFTLGSIPVWVLRDNRGDGRGSAALVKGASVVFYSMIGVGHAIELAQIVQPRLGHKRLNVALFTGRIARNEPAESAVSFAHAAHLVHGAQKVLGLLWVDAVLDLHYDGTFLRARFDEQSGRRDVPGSQILLFAVR